MRTSEEHDADLAIWEDLIDRVWDVLEEFGVEGLHDDYWVHSDFWGLRSVKVFVQNLKMLAPAVVDALQKTIAEFPSAWQVVVAVVEDKRSSDWPEMHLLIRAHEIVDGLQRSYFPPEYRDIAYPTARPWVAADD